MFREALYSDALTIFQSIGENQLAPMDRYRLNRSLEETGRIKEAIQGYIAIVNARRDATAVREANRRLLLLGTFNGAGSRVREYAETTAAELGDNGALQQIQEAAEEMRAAVVVEEIKQAGESGDNDLADLARQLEENIVLDAPLQSMPRPLIPPAPAGSLAAVAGNYSPPELAKLALEPAPAVNFELPGRLMIEFRDGRQIRARALHVENGSLRIEGDVPARVPLSVVRQVRLVDRKGQPVMSRPPVAEPSDGPGRIQVLRRNAAGPLSAWHVELKVDEDGAMFVIHGAEQEAARVPLAEVDSLQSP